jgi:hypothetical protein
LNVSKLITNSSLEGDDCLTAHQLHTSLLDYGRACLLGLFFAALLLRDFCKVNAFLAAGVNLAVQIE